jgi:hypothetical protein
LCRRFDKFSPWRVTDATGGNCPDMEAQYETGSRAVLRAAEIGNRTFAGLGKSDVGGAFRDGDGKELESFFRLSSVCLLLSTVICLSLIPHS